MCVHRHHLSLEWLYKKLSCTISFYSKLLYAIVEILIPVRRVDERTQ